MPAMTTLRGCAHLGPSSLSPHGGRGLCLKRQNKSFVLVMYKRLSTERQKKPMKSKGTAGMNLLPSRVSLTCQSDSQVTAKRPELTARFASSVKEDQCFTPLCHCQRTDQEPDQAEAAGDSSEETWGIQIAIALLKFYKMEISPLLPGSCRYVPTCSEYSMQAYRRYGVLKGTILTAWRISRCNPLGGSGFDPPRWFGETEPPS